MKISGGTESRRQVVRALREGGAMTRADLARLTGLSRSMVSTVVGELSAAGMVVEADEVRGPESQSQVGRPGVLISLDPGAGAAVGVDVGHRRIHTVVADLAHTVLAEAWHDLSPDPHPMEALDVAERLVEDVLREAGIGRDGVIGAGVGLPAPFERETGRVYPSSMPAVWGEVSLREEMDRRLGFPVYLDNDANLAALAELVWGAGQGVSDAACIMISDGIGAGLIIDGRVYRGAMGVAGEIGHTTMDENGPICRCGNRGCLEMLAGAPAVLESLRPSRGPDLNITRVIELAEGGDAACRRAIADAGRLIGVAVAALCNTLNPRRVIVNGELSEAGDMLLDPLRASLRRCALPIAANAEVVPGQLGAGAMALGGVALALRATDSFVAPTGRTAARDGSR